MMSFTEENYLKVLFSITQEKEEASVKELSAFLGLKMPTVNSMIKRLAEKKLVHYESYKPIKLTDLGRKKAALIVRKHRLTEMFLVEKMGFGWDEVHSIAEQVEHIQSDLFFDKMDQLLGFPTTDPHGSPIPTGEGTISEAAYRRLSDCQVDDVVTFMAVNNSSSAFLKFLTDKGLYLGLDLTILAMEDFDGTVTITIGSGTVVMLSKLVSDKMMVV